MYAWVTPLKSIVLLQDSCQKMCDIISNEKLNQNLIEVMTYHIICRSDGMLSLNVTGVGNCYFRTIFLNISYSISL